MGDRGNIVIETAGESPQLFFYTHWSGSDLPGIVADGLARGKDRWGDDSYLNRVLFQQMMGDDKDITGFGIDTTRGDGGTEVYICHDAKRVRYNGKTYTFQEFIDQHTA